MSQPFTDRELEQMDRHLHRQQEMAEYAARKFLPSPERPELAAMPSTTTTGATHEPAHPHVTA